MDLDELVGSAEPVALARAGKALGEATTLLRSSVSELHPTVLVHVGLARAIGDLARSAQGRGGVVVDVDTSGWNDELRTSADDVLFGATESFWATSSNMPARTMFGSSSHGWTTVQYWWSRTTAGDQR
ncbi:hypothetical protein GCM10020255_096130 [Rhodococcus baikonurensis]